MKEVEIYLDDLTPEAKEKVLKELGNNEN